MKLSRFRHYRSLQPKVVGEFDVAAVHKSIDEFTQGSITIPPIEVAQHLGHGPTEFYMHDVVGVRWRGGFNVRAYISGWNDDYARSVEWYTGICYAGTTYDWHPDTREGSVPVCPDVLMGASVFPPEFLVGTIKLRKSDIPENEVVFARDFWVSDLGKYVIAQAIEAGDLTVHTIEPGQIVELPGGGLHRKVVPPDHRGYRVFMRYCKGQ